jgi:hypothetical protein
MSASDPIICPRDSEKCESASCLRRGKPRQSCVDDANRATQRANDLERRGNPQRFVLTGMIEHHHSWEEDGQVCTDTTWSLPEIDPPLEQNETIQVVEASAYDELRMAVQRYFDTEESFWHDRGNDGATDEDLTAALANVKRLLGERTDGC